MAFHTSPNGIDTGRVDWVDARATLLAEELILPEQLLAVRPATPETRLCLAVLSDAIACATAPIASWTQVLARRWLASDAAGVFSARFVCDHLGIDLARLRAVVARRPRPYKHRTAMAGLRHAIGSARG